MSDYTPKYLTDLSHIPLSGPDEYTNAQKKAALQFAEAQLENDVNDGKKIKKVLDSHKTAVNALASHVLTMGADSPSGYTVGDLRDDGDQLMRYSSQFLTLYKMMRDSLLTASAKGGSSYYTYTTSGFDDPEGLGGK